MAEAELQAGTAAAVITPPVGSMMGGYSNRDRGATRVEDELWARALVLAQEDEYAVIVALDLLGASAELTAQVREGVAARTDIPAQRVLLCASHTHFGPVVAPHIYQDETLHGEPDPAYQEVLTRQIVGAVSAALEEMRPVELVIGSGEALGITFNRRPRRKSDGQVEMSFLWPEDPHAYDWGPVDPAVGVLQLVDKRGARVATLFNFACHPVTGGEDHYAISADYVGWARTLLEEKLEAPCLFLNGTCGNIVPRWRYGQSRKRIGWALGGAALLVALRAEERLSGPMRFHHRQVELPLKPLPSEAEIEGRIEAARAKGDEQALLVARQKMLLRRQFGDRRSVRSEVNLLTLGDLALVTLPGEVFVEIGLQIKAASPFPYTWVVSLTNGYEGYIPTEAAYDEGGYEPEWTKLARGVDGVVRGAAIEMLGEAWRAR